LSDGCVGDNNSATSVFVSIYQLDLRVLNAPYPYFALGTPFDSAVQPLWGVYQFASVHPILSVDMFSNISVAIV